MGAGKGGQTIGYHYLMPLLFGIGRGPVNEIRQIKVDDKDLYNGHICAADLTTVIPLDKPDLFGGEKKEGGIQGVMQVYMGGPDQVLPTGPSDVIPIGPTGPNQAAALPHLKTLIGGLCGELRGRVVVFYDGLVSSMNPYIKPWSFRLRRSTMGWHNNTPWYPAKATIYLKDGQIHAMNPAHILFETMTNPAWGRGLAWSRLGDTWITAANQFCAEGLGLCLVWYRQDDIDQFIQSVCNHAGCVVYTDRETGLIEIKLLRGDYDPEDLPLFTLDSGLLSIIEDDTGSSETVASEVLILGHDPISNQAIQGRAQNPAARRSQDGTATSSTEYKGLPTIELCNRVAAREMAIGAGGIRRFTVILDRAGYKLHPGAVFRVSYPKRGLQNLVLRAGEITDAGLKSGAIEVSAVLDVFGLPATSYIVPVENTWTPPSDAAVPPTDEALFELSYRDVYARTTKETADGIVEGQSRIGSLAGRPSIRSLQYRLLTRPEGDPDFTSGGTYYFTANAVLVGDLTATATTFSVTDCEDFPADADLEGDSVLIGEERMRIVSFTSTGAGAGDFVVQRGAADTWPETHAAGDRVWLPDDDFGTDNKVYLDGETVEAEVLTRTTSEELPEADATLMSIEVGGRIFRPFPPADVQSNAVSIYDSPVEGDNEPVITWVERNRLVQADQLVGFFEPTVIAEAGTTYRIRIYETESSPTFLREEDGIASGWVYDLTMQAADGVDTVSSVWAEIVSVRDGVESWPQRRFRVLLRSGWGLGWGLGWGGT